MADNKGKAKSEDCSNFAVKDICRGSENDSHHVKRIEIKEECGRDARKYIQNKLVNKGVIRQERHPIDGRPLKYERKPTRAGLAEEEFALAPLPVDHGDPNYADE
ncbi:unnamed protein product [Ilex paraguariensis]|uniref:Uncharacterized protein n=1 Tax=Ilex paraguariensis TaxID=185542 RepID=A0ABC8U2P3_9AQUA